MYLNAFSGVNIAVISSVVFSSTPLPMVQYFFTKDAMSSEHSKSPSSINKIRSFTLSARSVKAEKN